MRKIFLAKSMSPYRKEPGPEYWKKILVMSNLTNFSLHQGKIQFPAEAGSGCPSNP
jgi:hypothetical protein